jgi:hypothetical protein
MKKDLDFINYNMALERALSDANRKIKDGQQNEDLTEQEISLFEVIHEYFYLPGVVLFDRNNLDASKLKIVRHP